MKKKILSLILALLLMAGSAFAFALDDWFYGEDYKDEYYYDDVHYYNTYEVEYYDGYFNDWLYGYEDLPYIEEDGWFYSAEDVTLYLVTYGYLPENFITKDDARSLGWTGGSVEYYLEGAAIGGDVFGNREGLLPEEYDRTYYECDIDTDGQDSRGAKRLVFSSDGLIYYTEDHYESFVLLFGEEWE